MKYSVILVLLVFLLCSCAENEAEASWSDEVKQTTEDSPCVKKVKSFLDWYVVYQDTLAYIPTVDNAFSDTIQYRVNYPAMDSFLNILRESRYFSEKFIKDKLAYSIACDSNFLRTRQSEMAPEGFDYDWFLFTQEYGEWLHTRDKHEYIDSGGVVFIDWDGFVLAYMMTPDCLIDSIYLSSIHGEKPNYTQSF